MNGNSLTLLYIWKGDGQMRRILLVLLCFLILGVGTVRWTIRVCGYCPEPRAVAWWTLLMERPNPDRLPVKVHFQWVKGLEQFAENR